MRVHQHGLLSHRGGAAAVARMLATGLGQEGASVTRSFEVADGGASNISPCRPGDVVRHVPQDAIVHIHGSADLAACLAGLGAFKGRVVMTMHDCRLFTAGCPYPLDCRGWRESCAHCPRGFDAGQAGVQAVLQELARLDPLLVAPSRWLARLAGRAVPGAHIRVVPNGVPWPGARPEKRKAKRAVGVAPDARVALFAAHGGTSAAYKSGDKWFELWQGLKARVPGAVGFVAGGERQQRQGDLIFWPYLPENTLRGLMRAADLLVYPARADNHPLLVLEAMSEGTASLAFSVGGVAEQIIDGRTGFLVRQDDWAGFLERLAGLMARPGIMARAGREACESGRDRFSASRMVRDYMSLYRLVLDAPVSPAAS